ncbi:MAG: site-specific integrase [Pseudomonadota bacterium]
MTNRVAKLTARTVEQAEPGEARYRIVDTELKGFWLIVMPSGRKSYRLRYRVGGGRGGTIREPRIGEYPSMKPDAARRIAAEWLALVRQGGDPGGDRQAARGAPRMSDLFERYLADHAHPHKKAASVAEDERLIRDYLRPAFDRRKVAEVTRDQVLEFHVGLADRRYRANRALALLSKAMNLAELWGWRPDNTNPCRHVRKYREEKRKRFLSAAELARLGETLRLAELEGALLGIDKNGQTRLIPVLFSAIVAIRLLLFTGARKSEILALQWDWIDMTTGRAALPDSKTGEKTLHLPPAALAVLQRTARLPGNPHVIVGRKHGAALVNLKDPWGVIRSHSGLEDVRIHDLRHSFASIGAAGGKSLPIIGALLGHTQPATTRRYAHLADDPLRAAAAEIGEQIEAAMAGEKARVIDLKGP